MKKTIGKRLLSGVTSLLLAASYTLAGSGGLSALAATRVSDGDTTITDMQLLAGTNGLAGDTVEQTIKNYEDRYILGMAARFCAFIEGDFKPTAADAEGRVAVGGNYLASDAGYEQGNGDYVSSRVLDDIIDNDGFAHTIVNGNLEGAIPSSWNKYATGEGERTYPQKKIWISEDSAVKPPSNFVNNAGGQRWSGNYEDYLYKDSSVFDIAGYFDVLNKRSEKLAKKSDNWDLDVDTDVTYEIPYFNQYSNDPGAMGGKFEKLNCKGKAVFTYNGSPSAARFT